MNRTSSKPRKEIIPVSTVKELGNEKRKTGMCMYLKGLWYGNFTVFFFFFFLHLLCMFAVVNWHAYSSSIIESGLSVLKSDYE